MPSPYVSLRAAVRPAAFAYSMLAAEQKHAGALAAECDDLLETTRELLRKLAMARLLSPEPGHGIPTVDVGGDRQAMLLDAYADAGMLWAEVVGICMSIASVLLEQEQWDKVRHLASVLEDVGETISAKELSRRAKDGPFALARRRIKKFHEAMSIDEVRDALNALLELPKEFPNRNVEIAAALPSICISMLRLVPERHGIVLYQCDYVRKNGCQPLQADYFLSHAAAELARLHEMKAGS